MSATRLTQDKYLVNWSCALYLGTQSVPVCIPTRSVGTRNNLLISMSIISIDFHQMTGQSAALVTVRKPARPVPISAA